MLSVLVVGQDRFLDDLGDVLEGEGMSAVCADKVDVVAEAVQRGYRPEAIVVDPDTVLEPGGDELVRYLAGSPALSSVPVFSISAAMKRLEVAELLGTLRTLRGEGGLRA